MRCAAGKTLDTFCPMGPVIVPAMQLDPSALDIRLWVNGELRQSSNTSNMIFSVADIIHQLSSGFTLYPGTLIRCISTYMSSLHAPSSSSSSIYKSTFMIIIIIIAV